MAVILAIETATRLCSVALGRDGTCIALREEQTERLSHAERVNVFAQEILDEAGLSLDQVDAFAVGIGPGSYTGLRIGVSAAKGWSFALDKPIIGISTLRTVLAAAMAGGAGDATELWPMVDARRMEVFTQRFNARGGAMAPSAPLILDQAWVADRNGLALVCGDGADKAVELWSNAQAIVHKPGITASARYMIAEAELRYASTEFDDLAYLVPQYGKGANVAQPAKKRPL